MGQTGRSITRSHSASADRGPLARAADSTSPSDRATFGALPAARSIAARADRRTGVPIATTDRPTGPATPSRAKHPHRRRPHIVLIASVAAGFLAFALPAAASADTLPTVTAEQASLVGVTTAKLSAEVDGHGEATHRIQWSPQGTDHGAEGDENWNLALEQGLGPELGPYKTEALLGFSGELQPGESYEFRVVVENAAGVAKTPAPYPTFTMDAEAVPVLATDASTDVAYTTATLHGSVDPVGGNDNPLEGGPVPINWELQYREAGAFGPGEGWSSAPCPETGCEISAAQAESPDPVTVSAPLPSGTLKPATQYEVRLFAWYLGYSRHAKSPDEPPTTSFTTLPVARPTITALAASEVTGQTAHLSAEIDPGGSGDPVFDTHYHFECIPSSNPAAPHCSGSLGGTLPAGPEAEVQTTAKELQPNTTYTLRLIATNAGGERKATVTFSTPGAAPQINPFEAGPLGPTYADINAEVDPGGASTSYYFEWGTEDCSTGSCASIPPNHEANAGSAPYFTDVSRRLTGLSPQTTYHFRIVARNSYGIAEGPDREFTTPAPEPACTNAGMPGTDFLPDCRAYEMISPPDKNGAEVIPQTMKTHVRPDGDAVTFSSLGRFGDLEGSSFDTEYLAERTGQAGTNGWSTHGINPPGGSTTFPAAFSGNAPTFVNAFTPDLKSAVYRSWRPLTDAPNVEDVSNLYRIDGLDGASESAQLLSDSTNPIPELWAEELESFGVTLEYSLKEIRPSIAGASTDLSHVVFASPLRLTADAPPYTEFLCELAGLSCSPKLYENDNGAVRLVGRVPAPGETECSDISGPPCETAPSSDTALSATENQYSQYAISSDGDRIYFQAPANGTQPGPLYLREDGARTYKLADNGEFYGASADGSRAFFVTDEALLPSDHDGARDLYMWDREDLESQPLTLISAASSGIAGYLDTAIAPSADGSTVYFVNDGQLIAGGGPDRNFGLYRWHEGHLSYIGSFQGAGARSNSPRQTWDTINSAKTSRISPDGRFLLFETSSANGFNGRGGFSGYDHAGRSEFYVYDAASGRLRCASCNPSGEAAKTAALIAVRDDAITSRPTSDEAQVLAEDGRYVFFNSEEALVPRDTNGRYDAYEYDARTEQVHLLSSGTSSSHSYVIDSSPDGRDAYIVTRERLVGWDTDNAYDLYDVRVDGGFPEPRSAPAPCSGDACLPAAASSPSPPAIGSESPAPGSPPRACSKGKVKKHGRCVMKQKPKTRKKTKRAVGGRLATADRRANP